jgi:hypothetical protein
MTGFFNTVALTASNSAVAEAGDNTAALVFWMIVGIVAAGSWLAFFNNHWVAYSENPTKIARREMQIAIFAPITVPILGFMLVAKMVRGIKAVTA